jgi:hypothetical protein
MEGATALAASGRIASTIGTISFVSFVFILRFLVAGPSGGILLVVVVSRLGHHLIGERFRHAPNLFFFHPCFCRSLPAKSLCFLDRGEDDVGQIGRRFLRINRRFRQLPVLLVYFGEQVVLYLTFSPTIRHAERCAYMRGAAPRIKASSPTHYPKKSSWGVPPGATGAHQW